MIFGTFFELQKKHTLKIHDDEQKIYPSSFYPQHHH